MAIKLNSNFTECECVYSKKLGKFIPVFKLIPRKDEEDDYFYKTPGIENTYVSSFEYPKTGERFDVCTDVIKGTYDLIKKEIQPLKKVVICDSWITKELKGEKVIDDYSSREEVNGKIYVNPLTITEVFLDKKIIEEKGLSTDNITFIKSSNLKSYLEKYNKRIVGGDDINTTEETLIKLSEIYVECKLSNGKTSTIKFLKFLKN